MERECACLDLWINCHTDRKWGGVDGSFGRSGRYSQIWIADENQKV